MSSVFLIVGPILLAGGFAVWKRQEADWRPFLPGIVATGLGVGLSIAAYEWLFEASTCTSKDDIACVLNANQGLLTALTVLLAVIALWVTLVVRELDRRAERRLAQKRACIALEEAADEWAHNLIHIAIASDDDGHLEYGVQVSTHHTERLFNPDIASLLDDRIMNRSDRLRRTYERLMNPEDDEDAENALTGFVNNSMRLLVAAHRNHPSWCASVLERPGFQDIRRLAPKRIFITFRSSRAIDDAPRLRREEIPVLCWVNDECPQGVEVFSQLPRFQDMNHPPHE